MVIKNGGWCVHSTALINSTIMSICCRWALISSSDGDHVDFPIGEKKLT